MVRCGIRKDTIGIIQCYKTVLPFVMVPVSEPLLVRKHPGGSINSQTQRDPSAYYSPFIGIIGRAYRHRVSILEIWSEERHSNPRRNAG